MLLQRKIEILERGIVNHDADFTEKLDKASVGVPRAEYEAL